MNKYENINEKAMILRLEHLIDEELVLLNETTPEKKDKLEKANKILC